MVLKLDIDRVNPQKKDCVLFVTEELLKRNFIYFCECQTHNALREKLFKSINECHPGFEDMELREKFIYILKCENRKLAKFTRSNIFRQWTTGGKVP